MKTIDLARRALLGAFAALLALPAVPRLATADSAGAAQPVVVELFTSQGCYSCPPADAFLGELTKRADIIALAYHIDYWDYIGWKDPYGSAANTERQQDYAAFMGKRMVYTPQMVIAGQFDAVGSNRKQVEAAIVEALAEGLELAVVADESGAEQVTVSGAAPNGATVYAVFFLAEASTPVARGENAGKTLVEYNIVRDLVKVGSFDGGEQSYAIDEAGTAHDGCAILVQDDRTGVILGATLMPETGT